jgi:hypothetical protein
VSNNISNNKYTKKFDQEYKIPYRKPRENLTDSQKKRNKIKRTLAVSISNPWCEVCGDCPVKRCTLHHHSYFPDSTVYKNYKTQTDVGNLEYYEALKGEVKLRPWNFSVLCNSHHRNVHELLDMPIEIAEHVIKKQRQWLSENIKLYPKFADRHREQLADYDRLVWQFYRSVELIRFQKQGVTA